MKRKFLKPIIASLVALVIPLGLATTALSDDITNNSPNQSGSSPITAEFAETYTVTIPASYTFQNITKSADTNYTSIDGTVSVANRFLITDHYLHVAFGDATGGDNYNLVGDTTTGGAGATNKIAFDIYETAPDTTLGGTPIGHNSKVIKNVTNTDGDTSKHCVVAFDRSTIPGAGSYSGSVKFTVIVNDTPEEN